MNSTSLIRKSSGSAFLSIWISVLTVCNVLGWGLSILHLLSGTGFVVGFLIVGVPLAVFAKRADLFYFRLGGATRFRKRFGRALPFTFLVLALLALLGGLIYPPNNYDALAYRTPRVLHWLAEHQWHWIHTEFQRLNVRGAGFEWVTTPLIAWMKTDRFLFLINFISFCFLPGLFFSVFRRLGVSAGVAYAWMWIFPCAYGFLLQAGSVGNDLFAAFLVLAAIHFGLCASQDRSSGALWLSLICAGLFTGVKANNLPLVLVCAVTLLPTWRVALVRPLTAVLVSLIATIISFAPIAALNQIKTHDWTGGKAEHVDFQTKAAVWVRPLGNLGIMAMHSFLPPIAPFARVWNERIAPKLLPRQIDAQVGSAFMEGGRVLRIPEMEIEEEAGLGLGVSGLLVVSTIMALLKRCATKHAVTSRQAMWVWGAAILAFGALLEASSVGSAARLALAYYPILLFPLLLLQGQAGISRSSVFKTLAIAASLLAALLMVINPARPLFPVKSLLRFAHAHGANGALLARAERVYSVYGERADAFRPALQQLPANVKTLGMVTFDDPEAAMWRPFGSRKVVHVCIDDGPEHIRMNGIQYIWVHPRSFTMLSQRPFTNWLQEMDGELTDAVSLNLRAGEPAEKWQLVKLR